MKSIKQKVTEKFEETIEKYRDSRTLMTSFLLMIVLIIIFTWINPRFISGRNVHIILNQISAYMVLAVGMTFVLTSSGIDISIGSMLALIGVVTGLAMVQYSLPVWLGILILLGMGIVCGIFNAFFIAFFNVPPFIVTLGAMSLYRGLAYVILRHEVVFGLPQPILNISRLRIFGFSPGLYIALIVVIIGYYIFNFTPFGNHVKAIGTDKRAAQLSGVKIKTTIFKIYTLMGVLTGIATLIWLSRLNAVQANLGYHAEFHVIAAVVLGGTSLFGGKGLMLGTVMGVLILGILQNGLVLTGLPSFWQEVILGVIFINIVAYRVLNQRRSKPGSQ